MSNLKTKDSVCEEYYPISMEILQSFPKYRPQVDLFVFKEDIAQLYPVAKKNARLTNEIVDELHEACKQGILFVSRSDQYIYVDLLAKQAELVLFNSHLLESEIVQILFQALEMRFNNLVEQPLESYYEPLYKDVMVFCEYIWKDPKRINAFLPKIAIDEFKVSVHIVYKTSPLNKEEAEKYQAHVRQGAVLLNKFGVSYPATLDAVVQHHERIDGSGYPSKMAGNKISESGCISIVANVFVDFLAPRHGVPKLTMSEALTKLAKDNALPANVTAVLVKGFAEKFIQKAK